VNKIFSHHQAEIAPDRAGRSLTWISCAHHGTNYGKRVFWPCDHQHHDRRAGHKSNKIVVKTFAHVFLIVSRQGVRVEEAERCGRYGQTSTLETADYFTY
tara:strand:- start:178 stop:477 length:300 start_codon:yes stop_codon:yes gene_type:complete